jgi:hypothetical protein
VEGACLRVEPSASQQREMCAQAHTQHTPQPLSRCHIPQPPPNSRPVHGTYEAPSLMPVLEPVRHTTRGAPRLQHGFTPPPRRAGEVEGGGVEGGGARRGRGRRRRRRRGWQGRRWAGAVRVGAVRATEARAEGEGGGGGRYVRAGGGGGEGKGGCGGEGDGGEGGGRRVVVVRKAAEQAVWRRWRRHGRLHGRRWRGWPGRWWRRRGWRLSGRWSRRQGRGWQWAMAERSVGRGQWQSRWWRREGGGCEGCGGEGCGGEGRGEEGGGGKGGVEAKVAAAGAAYLSHGVRHVVKGELNSGCDRTLTAAQVTW